MGVVATCTCTPYLSGNLPHFGEHIAWAESSAVCYANSVLGARSNREGGPSALAAALTGRHPGLRLTTWMQKRTPDVTGAGQRRAGVAAHDFGALGKAIGERLAGGRKKVPYRISRRAESLAWRTLKCAVRQPGHLRRGGALPHARGYAGGVPGFAHRRQARDHARQIWTQAAAEHERCADADEVDFVSLGCPHLSIDEIARMAELLRREAGGAASSGSPRRARPSRSPTAWGTRR